MRQTHIDLSPALRRTLRTELAEGRVSLTHQPRCRTHVGGRCSCRPRIQVQYARQNGRGHAVTAETAKRRERAWRWRQRGLTYRQIAAKLHVSVEWARQLVGSYRG